MENNKRRKKLDLKKIKVTRLNKGDLSEVIGGSNNGNCGSARPCMSVDWPPCFPDPDPIADR
ncbi:hypothetical protein [Aquimarina algiphila]|uniref:hypothetical protein n=1 Tax=Aquimarina algiphila TaxID=2047982 RepID=UPI00232B854D|nr:hypothetical protein [Aquimarina algiphila]